MTKGPRVVRGPFCWLRRAPIARGAPVQAPFLVHNQPVMADICYEDIFGEEIAVHAKIVNFQGLSSHADRDHLLAWIADIKAPKPQHVFIVHGEPEASKALRVRIERELAGYRATAGSGVPPMSTGIRVRLPRP